MDNKWSLIPLTKIINAHSQLSRILWTIFSITMVGGLFICIIITIHQYLDNATVFRMDYLTSNYFNDLPAVTMCHNNHRVKKYHTSRTKENSSITYDFPSNITPKWSTTTARSDIYRTMSNYSVLFKTDPSIDLILTVAEEFPRPKDQICTIFELAFTKDSVWTSLEIMMNQDNPTTNDYFEVVIHNKQSFPFNNYEKYLYQQIDPGKRIFMFISKSVTNHLDTFRNPCSDASIDLLNINFEYDQTVCQWQQMCNNLEKNCHCPCELNVIEILNNSCPDWCSRRFSRSIVSPIICPRACHKTKYSDLNVVTMEMPTRETSVLIIVMSDLVSIATEEPIYTLTKMFSEIGGLSSLLFGVSSILFFELLEKILHSMSVLDTSPKQKRPSRLFDPTEEMNFIPQSTSMDGQSVYSYPVEVNIDELTYRTVLSYENGVFCVS